MTAASDRLPRTPNLWLVTGGRGTQVVGANHAVWRETQALSASARQLTPQADERGIRLTSLRAWALCFATSLVLVLPAAASAQAPAGDASGGAAFQEPPPPPPPPVDITVPG